MQQAKARWWTIGVAVGVAAPGSVGALWGVCQAQATRTMRTAARPWVVAPTADGWYPGAGSPVRIAWLGDSVAAGLGAERVDETPAAFVARELGPPCRVHVLAVAGSAVHDVAREQVPLLRALVADGRPPDLIILSVGANDVGAGTRRRAFARALDGVLDACGDIPVLLLSIPDVRCASLLPQPLRAVAALRARQLDRVSQRVAARRGVGRVDISTLPAGWSRRDVEALLSADRFHPGGAGYQLWGERIATAAAEVLEASGGERVALVDEPAGVGEVAQVDALRRRPRQHDHLLARVGHRLGIRQACVAADGERVEDHRQRVHPA